MATGFISMENLVFLLYELPSPLGKKSAKCHLEDISNQQTRDNHGFSLKDKFIYNVNKKIFIKKINALDLFKDMKI